MNSGMTNQELTARYIAEQAKALKALEVKPEEKVPGKLYLNLFHGRDDPNQDLNDWGFEGPSFGPLSGVGAVYTAEMRLFVPEQDEPLHIQYHEDMLTYDGKFYGDWSAITHEV